MAFVEKRSSSTFKGAIYKIRKRPETKVVVFVRWAAVSTSKSQDSTPTPLTRHHFHGGRNLGCHHLPLSPLGPEPLSRPQTHLPLHPHFSLHPFHSAARKHFPVSEEDKTDGLFRGGGGEAEHRGGGESERGDSGESDLRRPGGGEARQEEIRAANVPCCGCDVELWDHFHGCYGSLLPVFMANGGKAELLSSLFSPVLYFFLLFFFAWNLKLGSLCDRAGRFPCPRCSGHLLCRLEPL